MNKSQHNAILKVQRLNRLHEFYFNLSEHKRHLQEVTWYQSESKVAVNNRISEVSKKITYTRQQINSIKF